MENLKLSSCDIACSSYFPFSFRAVLIFDLSPKNLFFCQAIKCRTMVFFSQKELYLICSIQIET